MISEKELEIRMARQKFGRIFSITMKKRIKSCEESFSVNLSILHDSYRNEDWANKLKDIIRIDSGVIGLS